MRNAQRKSRNVGDYFESLSADGGDLLDDGAALEHLEIDLDPREDRDRIIGIGNGLLLGAGLWLIVLVAVGSML